jgi:TatA/E family protein of Tat protein translocase
MRPLGSSGRQGYGPSRVRARASLCLVGIDNPVHLLFIAVVALVVLGPKRLPELTRALGHGIREFREAINAEAQPEIVQPAAAPVQQAAAPVQQAAAPVQQAAAPVQQAAAPVQQAAADPVDPTQAVRSGDAPDRGPL